MTHENFKSHAEIDKSASAVCTKPHTSGFLDLVADAKFRITEINVHSLADKLTKVPLHLIDVRELDEYKQGAIPHAMHLSKGTIERDIEKLIADKTAAIVVYCSGGFRSCLVADNLQKMGYQQVASLMGGIRAWLEAGYTLTR